MRTAPPVSVRGSGGFAWRGVQALLPALAAGVLAAWALGLFELPTWPALGAAALAGTAAWCFNRPVAVLLAWDGQVWSADGQAGELEVMLDLNSWLLLRLRPRPRGAALWLALNAAEAGPKWHGLRVAAYGPVPTPETQTN